MHYSRIAYTVPYNAWDVVPANCLQILIFLLAVTQVGLMLGHLDFLTAESPSSCFDLFDLYSNIILMCFCLPHKPNYAPMLVVNVFSIPLKWFNGVAVYGLEKGQLNESVYVAVFEDLRASLYDDSMFNTVYMTLSSWKIVFLFLIVFFGDKQSADSSRNEDVEAQ